MLVQLIGKHLKKIIINFLYLNTLELTNITKRTFKPRVKET